MFDYQYVMTYFLTKNIQRRVTNRMDEYKIYTLKFNLRFMHLKVLKGEMNPLE